MKEEKVIDKINEKIEKWFFWFWVKKYKVSFLLIFLIIFAGLFSMYTIPKESSPDIKFWVISINTIYPWVNPSDIDSLITDKIEKEIKDISWIKKITSTSSVWMSFTNVELYNGIDTKIALTDIKNAVDKVVLPDNAEKPNVVELSSSNKLIFEVLLYWSEKKYSKFDLIWSSNIIKNSLEWVWGISTIDLTSANIKWWPIIQGKWDYEIKVLLDKNKIELLWLSLRSISQVIKSYNKNTPIWNYIIWNLKYDFRFDWELSNVRELKNIVIKWKAGSYVYLGDVATIVKKYKWDDIKKLGFYNKSWFNYTSLVFNKTPWSNIFTVSKEAKKSLENLMSTNPKLRWLKVKYTKDMSELIVKDFDNLSNTAIQTIVLVFLTILIFIWLRESIIASMLIPLAFLVTFIVLDTLWLSLNFLTNFSLVLTLWIAIDTVIVIIEWASEKIKLWYNKRSAILLAVRDYKAPLIAWTLTTLVAFLPLMFLPGVMWKFLAYIPITVFSTLLAALILSLTVSSALFIKFIKDSKYYIVNKELESTFSEKQTAFLANERIWKIKQKSSKSSIRNKVLEKMWTMYYILLKKVILSKTSRMMFIFIPIILLGLSFLFLSPKIGFVLFPASDKWVITWSLEIKWWGTEKSLEKYLPQLDKIISKYPELKVYYNTVSKNKIDLYIELLDEKVRKREWMRNVFEIEKLILKDIKELESDWLLVSLKTLKEWPPTWKAIWIKLIANNSKKVEDLKKVAIIFKEKLKNIKWSKNVSMSSQETPGQFIFRFNNDKLANIWLTPDDILWEVYFYTSWFKVWSIKSEYEDNNIILKIKQFDTNLSPDDINNLVVNTKIWKIRVWDFADYNFTKAVSSISREKWKISIIVESDVEFWKLPSDIQPIFVTFAENYNYPDGISYVSWWENSENSDLILSTMKSLFIALFLIFSILVFQFNSFAQPAIVLYSVLLALLWVNVWLFITWNPYSMTFGIWFIALTWVVVNDAIILIDKINKNIAKWINDLSSIVSAGKSRLQPIIVTTLTTVFWVLPLALQNEFWAWLWFTIIFWLFAWSLMTLFVIPSLYYSVILKKNNKKFDNS